jgi:hypothetical protein
MRGIFRHTVLSSPQELRVGVAQKAGRTTCLVRYDSRKVE